MNEDKKKIKKLYIVIGALAITLIGVVAFVVGQQSAKTKIPFGTEEEETTKQENFTKKDIKEVEEKSLQVYTFFEKEQPIDENQFEKFINTFMTNEFKKNKYNELKDTLKTDFEYGTTLLGLTGLQFLGDPTEGWLENFKLKESVIDESTQTIKVFVETDKNYHDEKAVYWTEWIKENGEWKLYTTDFFEQSIKPKSSKELE